MNSCPVCGKAIDPNAASCPSCGAAVAVEAVSAVAARTSSPRWYVLRDNQRLGPYSWEQMQQKAAAGHVQPRQHVWKEGTPDWVEARTVVGLCPAEREVVEIVAAEPIDVGPARRRRDPWDEGPAPGGQFFAMLWLHLCRAFAWNLAGVTVAESEKRTLDARGISSDAAHKYLVWRRSIFLVVSIATCITILLHVITMATGGLGGMSGFGVLTEVVRLLAQMALPATAILAFVCWSRVRLSRWLMVLGWSVSFAVPILIALFPLHWLYQLNLGAASDEDRRTLLAGVQLVGGLLNFIVLMPAVLSILPGVLRACIRLKALVPQSIITGWFLIAGSPFYALLLFVTFVTINQMAGNVLLIIAVVFFMGAPLVYLAAARFFVRPLSAARDIRVITVTQILYTVLIAVAIVFLLTYLFTASFMTQRIIGFSSETSLMRPWQLIELYIDFTGRSLFTSTLVADLFLLMNYSVWHHMRAFNQTDDARRYDGTMDELGGALARS